MTPRGVENEGRGRSMRNWIIGEAQARGLLSEAGKSFVELMRHGSMSVELYAPKGRDPQQPHGQDELYIVASGSGAFSKSGDVRPFKAGDVIFVEAGLEHRFETFTEDFATWVIFWGPEGGETPA
jgi:mannose-6-phosphate isomerase-like protein (cupin superfamily)